MEAKIYIKGTFDRDTRIGCAAYELETDDFESDKMTVLCNLDKGRGTYQMELLALIEALAETPSSVTGLTVYTNNKAVASWLSRINEDNCCDDFYMKYIEVIRERMKRIRFCSLNAEWIKKDDPAPGNVSVNSRAHERLNKELMDYYKR